MHMNEEKSYWIWLTMMKQEQNLHHMLALEPGRYQKEKMLVSIGMAKKIKKVLYSGFYRRNGECDMNYNKIAKDIKKGYNDLRKDKTYKLFHVIWNDKLKMPEITVETDAGFKAIIIGNTGGTLKSRGYMYLFYASEKNVPFPTIKEIERRLKIVASKEVLTDNDADYFDWDEYESLEKQREYFSEIVVNAATRE